MNKNEEKRRKREKTSRSSIIRDGAGDEHAPSTISACSFSRESSSREPPSNNATTTTTTTQDKLQDAMKSTTAASSSSTGSNKDMEQRKQEQRLPRKKQARKEETTTKTRTSSSNNESRQQHARTIMAAMTVSTTRESNNEEEQRFHQPNRNATTKRRKNKDTNDLKDYCKAKKKNHHHGNERCASGLSMESSALRSQRRAIRNAKQGQVSSTKEPTTSSTSSTRTTTTTTIGEMHNDQAHSPNRINHATTTTRTMESRETRLNRSTMTTTKSRRKRRTSDDELTGAFQVSGRAIGALPAWARRSNEQGESSSSSDDDDNVPPEMRMVRHASSSNRREEQQHAASFSPRDAQFDMPFQEQVPSITTDDEQFMLPAQVRSGPSSSRYPEPKVLDETRATKIWFMVAVSVLVATGIAVGVSVGLASKRNNDNASANECDFSSQEQPLVFLQCQCMGDIAIYSERTMNQYQVLLDTVMPLVNPDFNQHVSSCTPDNLALAWLATDEYSIMETNQEVLINRYVLAFLFQVWSGPSWKDNLGWLSPTPECDWYGISCEENAIVGLELGGNSLASTTDDDNGLPSELFTLTSLKTFNASAAAFRGSIPFEVSSLVNLEVLDLGSSQNRLGKYRDELFSLPNLRVLDLAYPTGGSSIPTYVGLLSRLEILNAAQAGLFGVLPTELGGATSLVTIVLHSNGITGTVPTELGLLTNVHHLDLASNLLGEAIPFEIGNMVQLRNLDLGVNAFRGAIPPQVAALPHLEQLRLRENRLTGTIPIELLDSGRMLCFDASSNSQMDNSIPQGQCIQGTAQMAVACEDESDQACSCCVCWRTGSVEYCKQIVL